MNYSKATLLQLLRTETAAVQKKIELIEYYLDQLEKLEEEE